MTTFECVFCGRTQTVRDPKAKVWCSHGNQDRRQRAYLMQRKETANRKVDA